MKMKFRITFFLLVLLPVMCRAELVQIGFSGVVNLVGDSFNLLENGIQVNNLISGFYIYDSEEVGSNGTYLFTTSPCKISVSIGNLTFKTDPIDVDLEVDITNKEADLFILRSDNNVSLNNGIGDMYKVLWRLDDSSGTALSSNALSLSPLDLSKWDYNRLTIYGCGYPTPPIDENKTVPFEIIGNITAVWLVPEPTTFLLFGLGCIFLRRQK